MAKRRGTSKTQRRPRFGDVVDAYQRDLQALERSSDPAERHRALQKRLSGYALAHLRRFFRQRPVSDVKSSLIRGYAMRRQDRGVPAATINEELKTLWQLTLFASRNFKIEWTPVIEYLRAPEAAPSSRSWLRDALRQHAQQAPSAEAAVKPRESAPEAVPERRRRGPRSTLSDEKLAQHRTDFPPGALDKTGKLLSLSARARMLGCSRGVLSRAAPDLIPPK